MGVNESELIERLASEGYERISVVSDPPHKEHPGITELTKTVYILLRGELVIEIDGKREILREGDRLDMFEGSGHALQAGKTGAKYVVAHVSAAGV